MGVTLALQEWIDAAVILAVVMVNAAIGFLQESKAEKAIAALGNLVPEEATVIRDGQPRRLRVAEIVPGDLVSLEAGDTVPADLRLVHTRSLRDEEAMLTGESVPVGKHTDALAGEFPLAERKNSVSPVRSSRPEWPVGWLSPPETRQKPGVSPGSSPVPIISPRR